MASIEERGSHGRWKILLFADSRSPIPLCVARTHRPNHNNLFSSIFIHSTIFSLALYNNFSSLLPFNTSLSSSSSNFVHHHHVFQRPKQGNILHLSLFFSFFFLSKFWHVNVCMRIWFQNQVLVERLLTQMLLNSSQMLHQAWVLLITAKPPSWNWSRRRSIAMWSLRLMRRKGRLWLRRPVAPLRAMMISLHLCLRMIADMPSLTSISSLLRIVKRAKSSSLHG